MMPKDYSPEMQEYFDMLPAMIQESIFQSGAKLSNLEELKRFAENVEEKQR